VCRFSEGDWPTWCVYTCIGLEPGERCVEAACLAAVDRCQRAVSRIHAIPSQLQDRGLLVRQSGECVRSVATAEWRLVGLGDNCVTVTGLWRASQCV